MEWLTNLLSAAKQGASPFGALGGGGAAAGAMQPTAPLPFMNAGGQPAATPGPTGQSAPASLQSGGGLPGIWGRMLGQQPQAQGPQGQQGMGQQGQQTNNAALGQAMQLLQPKPLQPPSWMPWMK